MKDDSLVSVVAFDGQVDRGGWAVEGRAGRVEAADDDVGVVPVFTRQVAAPDLFPDGGQVHDGCGGAVQN